MHSLIVLSLHLVLSDSGILWDINDMNIQCIQTFPGCYKHTDWDSDKREQIFSRKNVRIPLKLSGFCYKGTLPNRTLRSSTFNLLSFLTASVFWCYVYLKKWVKKSSILSSKTQKLINSYLIFSAALSGIFSYIQPFAKS